MSARISATEQAKRRAHVDAVRHSSAMSGLRSSDEDWADQDAYARGELTLDELGQRSDSRWTSAHPETHNEKDAAMQTTWEAAIESEVTPAQVRERVAFADAALALAGHEVTDPQLRALTEKVTAHEMTVEQALAEARRHVQG